MIKCSVRRCCEHYCTTTLISNNATKASNAIAIDATITILLSIAIAIRIAFVVGSSTQ